MKLHKFVYIGLSALMISSIGDLSQINNVNAKRRTKRVHMVYHKHKKIRRNKHYIKKNHASHSYSKFNKIKNVLRKENNKNKRLLQKRHQYNKHYTYHLSAKEYFNSLSPDTQAIEPYNSKTFKNTIKEIVMSHILGHGVATNKMINQWVKN